MSRFETTPRSRSFAPLLLVALTLVVLLFFWTATRPPTPAEWAVLAREAIVRGQPLPPPPSGITVHPFDGKTPVMGVMTSPVTGSASTPVSSSTLVSVKLDQADLGFGNGELMRMTRIDFPGGISSASIRWAAGPDWGLRVAGSVPIILPWTVAGSEPLMLPASETEIRAFIASAGGSWTSPDPLATSGRLIDRLQIRTLPPRFLTPIDPKESANWMGPLFRAGKLPSTAGLRLPLDVFQLSSEAALLPMAHGLLFEGIRLAVPPEISWDKDFQRAVSEIATLAFLADFWERRSQTLATWLPALSDEVGPLLGSGFLRFNRPDLLPATATILTPMDEITILRAFHAVRADSGPVLWYPRMAGPASTVHDPFQAIQLLSRRFSTPDDLLQFLRAHSADSFDHCLWLESGDLTLEEIPGAGFRLIACGSGSITLKGPCTAHRALVISRGGPITVSAGATRIPSLLALPTIDGRGGAIRFDHPATITEPLAAETLELLPESGTIVFKPDAPPDPQPIALLLPLN